MLKNLSQVEIIDISFIIPYYNADMWIGRMLDSMLRQDLPVEKYEIIIVDDGSKEEPKLLMEYVKRYDNIKYIRQENRGPGAARNTGIECSKGEYLFFCDSDDYISENVLGNLCAIAQNRGLDMLFFNVARVAMDEIISNPKRDFNIVKEFSSGQDFFSQPIDRFISMGPCQYIISRSFVNKYNLRFPPDMIMNEDACFLIDSILVSKKTAKVDADVYFYVQNPQSLLHFSGKVLQAERWTNNVLLFIFKLNQIIKDKELTKNMSAGCLKNLLWLKNNKSYIVLVEGCRYLPSALFNKVKLKLLEMDSYPKPYGNHIIKKKIILRPNVLKILNILFGIKRRK